LLIVAGLAGLPAARADINGFGDGSQFLINDIGTPASITSDVLQITANSDGEQHGVWYIEPQIVTAFTASFTWQLASDSPSDPADGFTFTIQNDPRSIGAVGGGGGCLGYCGITPSFSVGFSVWGDHPRGINFQTQGNLNRYTDLFCAGGGGIDLLSHDPINISLSYDGTNLSVVAMDTMTGVSLNFSYTVDVVGLGIAASDGTGTVGFTGATGGAHSDQLISNFTYHEVH